jgi:hypothetical protein
VVRGVSLGQERPPFGHVEVCPLRRLQPVKPKPILYEPPNPNGEATMNEEVVICLLGLLAKCAKIAIFPTSLP